VKYCIDTINLNDISIDSYPTMKNKTRTSLDFRILRFTDATEKFLITVLDVDCGYKMVSYRCMVD
jgi:hypothetical protein